MAGILGLLMSGAGLIKDQYFNRVSLLLPGNGTNGAQNNTFLDSSTNNFTITRNGNTTQGTFSPFSQTGWGNYFDGSGDYLTVTNTVAIGAGSFTMECWVYLLGTPSGNYWIYGYRNSANTSPYLFINSSRIPIFGGDITTYLTGSAIPLNTWTHIAIVRDGTAMALYQNGVSTATTTTSQNFSYTGANGIGRSIVSTVYDYYGYISNFRIVVGTAVYDSAFTPPTTPLTAISGTSLLTCQSNRFIDNSSNAFTITPNGGASVVAFSPFNPLLPWTAANNGGSGYFDGTGDYLTFTKNSTTGSFTCECWFYKVGNSPTRHVLFGGNNTDLANSNQLAVENNGDINYIIGTGSATILTAGIQNNTWTHIAFVRSGSSFAVFVNGSRLAAPITNANALNIDRIGNIGTTTAYIYGYISGSRIVDSAVYDPSQTTLTVPTTPLTAISNTYLLLNYTNAGIYDATSKNDLETVGNAQISTSVSKFGGGSIAFDGTGDYLITDNSDNILGFGTGDWTIEFWLRLNSTGTQVIFDGRRSSASDVAPLVYYSSGLKYYTVGGDRISGGTLSTGVWYYIAIVKSSGSTRMYIDGSQTGSTYTDGNNYIQQSQRPIIGAEGVSVGANPLNGYIDDFRVTKGYARTVTAAPTAPFPVQ